MGTPRLRTAITRVGVPCGAMGVEVSQDEGITLGIEEKVKCRKVVGGTGGGRWNVDIDDVDRYVVNCCGDSQVFDDVVVGEK